MVWHARTNSKEIVPGTRLCIYLNGQISGQPEPEFDGEHPIEVEVGHSWIEAKITHGKSSSAVLILPNGEQYHITPRRNDELDSGITTGFMWSRDWIVRGQVPHVRD